MNVRCVTWLVGLAACSAVACGSTKTPPDGAPATAQLCIAATPAGSLVTRIASVGDPPMDGDAALETVTYGGGGLVQFAVRGMRIDVPNGQVTIPDARVGEGLAVLVRGQPNESFVISQEHADRRLCWFWRPYRDPQHTGGFVLDLDRPQDACTCFDEPRPAEKTQPF